MRASVVIHFLALLLVIHVNFFLQMLNGFSLMLSLLQWHQHLPQNHVVSKDAADLSPYDVTTCLASFPLCSPIKLLLPREMTSLLLSNGFGAGIQGMLSLPFFCYDRWYM